MVAHKKFYFLMNPKTLDFPENVRLGYTQHFLEKLCILSVVTKN